MNPTTNESAPEVSASEAQLPTTDNVGQSGSPRPRSTRAPKRQLTAEEERDRGMRRALIRTSFADRQAITAALLSGFSCHCSMRAEEALVADDFEWPANVSRRSLGGLVSSLARRGIIVESGVTKGFHGRSHAGRVSLWLLARGARS